MLRYAALPYKRSLGSWAQGRKKPSLPYQVLVPMRSIVYVNIFILLAAHGAGAVNLFGTRALSERAAEKLEHEAGAVFRWR